MEPILTDELINELGEQYRQLPKDEKDNVTFYDFVQQFLRKNTKELVGC